MSQLTIFSDYDRVFAVHLHRKSGTTCITFFMARSYSSPLQLIMPFIGHYQGSEFQLSSDKSSNTNQVEHMVDKSFIHFKNKALMNRYYVLHNIKCNLFYDYA